MNRAMIALVFILALAANGHTGHLTASLDDIILLTQNGVSDDTIITFLETREIDFVLGTQEILRLRQAGVSENVIRYLLAYVQPLPEYYYGYGASLYSGASFFPYYFVHHYFAPHQVDHHHIVDGHIDHRDHHSNHHDSTLLHFGGDLHDQHTQNSDAHLSHNDHPSVHELGSIGNTPGFHGSDHVGGAYSVHGATHSESHPSGGGYGTSHTAGHSSSHGGYSGTHSSGHSGHSSSHSSGHSSSGPSSHH